MTILIAAFLELCDCEEHGKIVLSDKSKSLEFCSKEGARQEVKRLVVTGKIDKEEACFLNEMISASVELAPTDKYVEPLTRFTCTVINESKEFEDDDHRQEKPPPVRQWMM